MVNQNNDINPFDEIRKAVNDYYEKIIRGIYKVEDNMPILLDSYGQWKIRGGNGKTTVAKCIGTYRLGSEIAEPLNSIELYIKFYRGINGDGQKNGKIDYMARPKEPWKYEAGMYKLFQQSELVPEAFLFEDILGLGDKLITLSAGNQTLEQRIAEINSNNIKLRGEELALQQLPLFLNIASTQATFDNYAEENVIPQLIKGNKRVASNLIASTETNAVNKSLNYLRAWLDKNEVDKIPPETIALFEENYQPIITRLEKNRKKLIHGALDGENIVSVEKGGWKAPDMAKGDTGNIKFIDLESVRLGHPFFDLSAIATTPGSYLGPKQWEEMIKQYNKVRLRLLGVEPEETGSYPIARFFDPLKRLDSEIKINENSWKGMRSIFYAGVIHNLFKIGAKLKDREKFFPDSFKAMIQERPYLNNVYWHNRKVIALGIEGILASPESFVIDGKNFNPDAFTSEEIKKLEELLKFFREEGIIDPGDRCPMSLGAKHRTEYGEEPKTTA